MKTVVSWVRLASILDGTSYLILLFVAMPIDRLMGHHWPVRVMGTIHGGLFIFLALMLAVAFFSKRLSFWWCLGTGVVSVIPFVPFFWDRKLKRFDVSS
ncbi:MAG: DUF3817 domain-containing protein [Verrucomicrobiota bacterium]